MPGAAWPWIEDLVAGLTVVLAVEKVVEADFV
jgi:hypothetical protein